MREAIILMREAIILMRESRPLAPEVPLPRLKLEALLLQERVNVEVRLLADVEGRAARLDDLELDRSHARKVRLAR